MKLRYVFLIAATTLLVLLAVKTPLTQHLMLKDELSLSRTDFYILRNVLDSALKDNEALYQTYGSFLISSRNTEEETAAFETYADTYQKAQQQIETSEKKQEIVYVKRIASAFVMNNPAFYKRQISNNVITENGKGTDSELLTLFYLSDGKIMKSSPKQNSNWLGLKVGEKVLKTTGIKLYFDIKKGYSTVSYTEYKPLYD